MAINYKFPLLPIIFYDVIIAYYNKKEIFIDELKFTLNLTIIISIKWTKPKQ